MPIKELLVDLDADKQPESVRAKRNVLSKVLQGNWKTLIKGEGMEFAGFRQYTFEDDASRIDWKASLRSDKILVREFEEYKNLNVFVLIDVSDTMLFTSREKLKAEYAAELSFALCDAILKAGDAVGMGMFTDELVASTPPNIGSGAYFKIKTELSNKNNYGGPSDIKQVLKYIAASQRPRSLVIIVSDFINLDEGWESYLDLIAGTMDLIGIMIRDPRDVEFPKTGGQFMLQDPDGGESLLVDTKKVSKEFEEQVSIEEEAIRAAFSKTNSAFLSIRTNEDMYSALLHFFYKKKRIIGG